MATIGRGSTAKIAGACDDGTVRIYDSVTGVLRLSLRPKLPIQEMTGLPDGSLLVCTHSGRPWITLWDIQTGGLVHTFILEGEVKRTTVSLKGRYLACETSERVVNFWETASRKQHPDPLEKLEGNAPCWMAPEELIMVVDRGSAYIRNVATKGPPIHKFGLLSTAHSTIYSQTFDLLAVMSPYSLGHSLFILDVKKGTFYTLHSGCERLSFVAFSQTAKQLVCGGEAPGLETVDISTGRWTHFNFPATLASVSTLSNGTVVTNAQNSGIQILRLHQERTSPQQPTPPPLTMYPLDKGRIIVIIPASNDRIILLETATMSRVFSIPTKEAFSVAADHTVVLCASLKNRITTCYLKGEHRNDLQLWEFSHERPLWTQPMYGSPPLCSISPAGTRLVTFHDPSSEGSVRVLDARNGTPLMWKSIDNLRPFDITFDSEDRFYFHHEAHLVPYDINTVSQIGNRTTYSITRCAEQQLEGQVLEKCYYLDDGREWVFCGSQRICWVPPGYIGSIRCWAGSSLVMAGQDGTLGKLTFPES